MKKITSFSLFLTYFLISQSQIPYYVPKDSLVAWWPFSGNAQDESGNGNHGSNTGAALTTDRFGNSNRAYYFSGSNCNTRIDATLNVSKIKYGLTISAWVLRSGSGCIGPRILEFSPGYTSTYGYDGPGMAQWSWDNNYSYGWYGILTELPNGSVKGFYHSFNSTQNNVWTHMVFTIDGDSAKYYQDGKLIKSEISAGKISLGKYLAIGRMNHPAWDAFNGKIDDLGVWSRALTASEVQDLFYTCKPQNHVKLTTSDTITECSSLTLTSQNKNYASYKWSNGNSTSSATFTKSGLVTLTERDTNGCKNIDSIYVRILKDEIANAPDTIFYNPNSGDTLRINPSQWFGSNTFNYYNSAKSSISQIKQLYTNQDSIIWKGYAALKTNSNLKCPVSGKIITKKLPQYLPKDSLVGWWPFTGNANDESGNGNHGTVNGATLTSDRKGNLKNSYYFNGVNFNHIEISNGQNNNLNLTKNLSISCWFQSDSMYNQSGTVRSILSKSGDGVGNPNGYGCGLWGGVSGTGPDVGMINFAAQPYGNWLTYPGANGYVSINTWYHLAITYSDNDSTLKYYLNGNLVSTKYLNFNIGNNNNPLWIGSAPSIYSTNKTFFGKIDDMAIWNRALDSNEIKGLYFGCKIQNHKKLTTFDTITECSLLTLTSQNNNYASYKWSNGDTTTSATFTTSGLVILLETDTNGCKNIDSVYVRILKDEIANAPDTIFYNPNSGDTLRINPSQWFGSNTFNYYNSAKSSISQIKQLYTNQDSIIWQGYAALKTNSSLKCPVSGKIYAKPWPHYLPKDSLVGWWPFNGNANDESGNGNHGTVNGATLTSDRKGNLKNSYYFNGVNFNHIEISNNPNNSLNLTNNLSISCWFQSDSMYNQSSTVRSILSKSGDGVGNPNGYGLGLFGGVPGTGPDVGMINFSAQPYGNWLTYPGSNGYVNINLWYHLAITYTDNDSTLKYYLNGNLVSTKYLNFNIGNNNNPLWIGSAPSIYSSIKTFFGKIDDMAIWNRALDSNEIKDIYNERCRPQNHIKLTSSDTLHTCTSVKLTSKNKSYSKYRWSTGDSSLSTVIAKSGLVTLRETDSKGCVNIDSVYVRILKDEISQAPDTFLCNVKANDTLKFDLQNWFDNANVLYFDQAKNPVSTANFFVKAGINKTWTGFAALNSYPSLKCPIKGKVNASVVYPRLVNKFTDTVKTVAALVKPSILDAKYNKYRWSTGDTSRNITLQNSGSYWYAHYWNATINGVGRYCYQMDSFHLSRINLITPSRISAKLGSKIIIKVKDSLNSNSMVVWSNGDTGWHTVYSVTKNSDTLFATQKDAYRSVTKSTVITGRLEPIKASQEGNGSGEGTGNGSSEDTNGGNSTQSNNSSNNTADAVAESSTNIRIYPNPVGSEITLDGLTHPMKYEIHTVTGQLVQTGRTSPKINVNNLQTGIYILKLENVSVKFVKE